MWENMVFHLNSNASKSRGHPSKSSGTAKKKNLKPKIKKNEIKEPEKPEAKQPPKEPDERYAFFPAEQAFLLIIGARIFSAFYNNISDCDETYNYWEPSHYLLFGKGFQTWEYNPDYALRSYTYLLLHVAPVWIYNNFFEPNRMIIFYCIRIGLGLFCSLCETYFYRAVNYRFGSNVGMLTLLFLLFSPGMFIASTAFLPSSFSMYFCFLSTGAWLRKKYEVAIFFLAMATFIGWPFVAFLGAPIAMDMLVVKKYYKKFIQWSLISTAAILIPLIKMDSDLFGKLVVAPFNIIKYNIFNDHGPDLYGTEPICFYLINGILNFNVAFGAAILAPSFLLFRNFAAANSGKKKLYFSSWLLLSPFYVWFVVFTLQPHKEERFMFPAYPFVGLCGAMCIESIRIVFSIFITQLFGKAGRRLANSQAVYTFAVTIVFVLGAFRIACLCKGYRAPMDVLSEMRKMTYQEGRLDPDVPINICYGKEWHRFPTNFLVPSNKWSVKFIRSEFKGQLPAEYGPEENATAIVRPYFNDLNLEEPSRYFNINNCDFLVDSNIGTTSELEPDYAAQTGRWSIEASFPFLNAEKSAFFFRSFHIPFVSDRYCDFSDYYLLRSTKFLTKTGKK